MKYYSILFLILFSSCSTIVDREFERVQTDEYYRDAGAVSYMLPLLPEWRDYSSEASCKRSKQMRYLNIVNLMNSFSIDHQTASQIQLAFNRMYIERSQNMDRSPTLKEVEQIFFSANDFVTATGGYLKLPKFKNVNIIWLDSYIDNLELLKKLMNSKSMLQGRPVFISLCLLEAEMKSLMKKAAVVFEGSYFVDYHYLTYFNQKGELTASEAFYLEGYRLPSVKKLKVFSHKIRPNFIKGRYKYINY